MSVALARGFFALARGFVLGVGRPRKKRAIGDEGSALDGLGVIVDSVACVDKALKLYAHSESPTDVRACAARGCTHH